MQFVNFDIITFTGNKLPLNNSVLEFCHIVHRQTIQGVTEFRIGLVQCSLNRHEFAWSVLYFSHSVVLFLSQKTKKIAVNARIFVAVLSYKEV
jgi:hypothetical protein